MIVFDKVTKKFGAITALDEISFKINKGEFVFLTGPSGAGKTTAIRLLVAEYLPTSGEISVNDQRISKVPRRKLFLWRRKIGVVYQNYRLFPDRTVAENVALPLQIRKTFPLEVKEKVENILSSVGLTDRADLFPAQLAGGELQRVSLARAIIAEPEVLLADEPTGNLDPATGQEMVKLFQQVNKKGTTVLMATHNSEIVDSTKARVLELKKGKLVRDEKEGKYKC